MSNEPPPAYDPMDSKPAPLYPSPNPMDEPQGGGPVHPPPAGAPAVHLGQVQVLTMPSFGTTSVQMECPHCHASIMTAAAFVPGILTWIIFAVFLLFGLWCGCCLIPFCVDSAQDVEHKCPNCSAHLGTYKRL